ncbi:hypothetical protein [[Flexibacter] sp. ATCC 35103]|uniref:hypothetical protein n=1 Tax=[Flexibacter] sp. ATCC 35103 TaxID=1937528 RepID=UPI0009CDA819|nr:hypothetical protein [[Flexibacter] sp. ATCC 35103]OMQ07916.1 hypothetical protein BXU01_23070 [[Flexibacter] sp. ATCC 35103]
MEFYPSKNERNLTRLFLNRRIAITRLNKLGISCPYISDEFTYEQLYLHKVEQDFNLNEVTFLKEGIVCIFDLIVKVGNEKDLTEKEVENQIRIKEKDRIESYRKLDGFSEKDEKEWISKNVNRKLEEDAGSKITTLSTLKKELAQFKINLGRFNVDVSIDGGKIHFLKLGEVQYKNLEAETITENPNPEIFVDLDAYIIFRKLHFIFKVSKSKLADYSFIYRRMSLDQLIHESCKPEIFRKWINAEPYIADAEPTLKTYDNCKTDIKENIYNLIAKGQY